MRKFGIELEVSGISKEQAADALNAAGIETVAENYNHRTRSYWKATTDSSIRSDNGQACELVSPPMPYHNSSFLVIAKVVAALKEAGATVNDSCGMHVHVDCRGINDPDFYRLLLTFYSKYENDIDAIVHATRRENNNTYCRTNKNLFDTWDNLWSSFLDVSPAQLTDVFASVERYYKLNFASFVRHGTVEFRQYQGTLDANDIHAWVDFCVNLVEHTISICGLESNKKILKDISVDTTYTPPQFGDYIVALANSWANENFAVNNQQYTDPFEAIAATNIVYSRAPERYAAVDTAINNRELNEVFAVIFQVAYMACQRAEEQNQISGFEDQRANAVLRDRNFKFNEDIMVYLTALFFGFNGTKEQVRRKAKAKLTNMGLFRHGNVRFLQPFGTFWEWLLEPQVVSANNISRNPYYRLCFDHNNLNALVPYKTTRFINVGSYIKNFIEWTRRFFVNNPRNLRMVSNGSFTNRKLNMTTECISLMLGSRYCLNAWNIEESLAFYKLPQVLPAMTDREAVRFNRTITSQHNNFHDLLVSLVRSDCIFRLIDSGANYSSINKKPYMELVDTIMGNIAIKKMFSNLSDTSKAFEVNPRVARDVEASVRRVRDMIQMRNNHNNQTREARSVRFSTTSSTISLDPTQTPMNVTIPRRPSQRTTTMTDMMMTDMMAGAVEIAYEPFTQTEIREGTQTQVSRAIGPIDPGHRQDINAIMDMVHQLSPGTLSNMHRQILEDSITGRAFHPSHVVTDAVNALTRATELARQQVRQQTFDNDVASFDTEF